METAPRNHKENRKFEAFLTLAYEYVFYFIVLNSPKVPSRSSLFFILFQEIKTKRSSSWPMNCHHSSLMLPLTHSLVHALLENNKDTKRGPHPGGYVALHEFHIPSVHPSIHPSIRQEKSRRENNQIPRHTMHRHITSKRFVDIALRKSCLFEEDA